MKRKHSTKDLMLGILFGVICLAAVAGVVLMTRNIILLDQAEYAEQIAQFGYYKEDIHLDFGRERAIIGSSWGAIACFVTAVITAILSVLFLTTKSVYGIER